MLEHLDDAVHRLEGIVISWVTIDYMSDLAGLTLAKAALRTETGAVVGGIHRGRRGDRRHPDAVDAGPRVLDPELIVNVRRSTLAGIVDFV